MNDIDWLAKANAAGIESKMHPEELGKLVELAMGRDVLEIGSYTGGSAWCMAHTAHKIMCVDTFCAWTNGQTQGDEFTTLEAFMTNLAPFPHVDYCVATSEDAIHQVHGGFDLIFLDAMHTYEDVKADIERWYPRLHDGGIIAFHDYGHGDYPGVKQAVDEKFGSLGKYRPPMDNWIVTLRWEHKR